MDARQSQGCTKDTCPPLPCSTVEPRPLKHYHVVQVPHYQASCSRASLLVVRAQAEGIEEDEGEVDATRLAPSFGGNSKFASVLAEALQRSGGADVLTSGPERFEEP